MTLYASFFPAGVVVNYHSQFGAHKLSLQTLAWDSAIGSDGSGGYEAWNLIPVQASTMIEDFVTAFAELNPTTTVFDDWVIYTKTSSNAPARPRKSGVLGIAGTLGGGDIPASQGTMTFRTTEFGILKVVMLDSVPSPDFLPQQLTAFTADQLAVRNEITSASNAWSGRDNAQADNALRITWTLNEKLRRAYRLT